MKAGAAHSNGRRAKKTRPAEAEQVRAGSGNVFADLGLSRPGEALAKAELAQRIGQLIAARGYTQAAAAAVLGLDQPKVSALLRGKLTGFSTDRLFRLLNALGQDVEIVVRPVAKVGRHAATRVLAEAAE